MTCTVRTAAEKKKGGGLRRKESRARVRQRRRESFLQPATGDITDFLLRGFSLIRKEQLCVRCVFTCVPVITSTC